jgi:hypothetical protein
MYYVAKNKGELAFTNFFTFYGIQNEVFPKNVKTNLPNFFGEIGSAFKELRRNITNCFEIVATINNNDRTICPHQQMINKNIFSTKKNFNRK